MEVPYDAQLGPHTNEFQRSLHTLSSQMTCDCSLTFSSSFSFSTCSVTCQVQPIQPTYAQPYAMSAYVDYMDYTPLGFDLDLLPCELYALAGSPPVYGAGAANMKQIAPSLRLDTAIEAAMDIDDLLVDWELQTLFAVTPPSDCHCPQLPRDFPSPTFDSTIALESALSNPAVTPTAQILAQTDLDELTLAYPPNYSGLEGSYRRMPMVGSLPLSPSRHSAAIATTSRNSRKPKRARKGGRARYRRRPRACELPADELAQQRKLAREAANRRRACWLEEQAVLDKAVAASERRAAELEAEHTQLQQELTILKDVIVYRHRD